MLAGGHPKCPCWTRTTTQLAWVLLWFIATKACLLCQHPLLLDTHFAMCTMTRRRDAKVSSLDIYLRFKFERVSAPKSCLVMHTNFSVHGFQVPWKSSKYSVMCASSSQYEHAPRLFIAYFLITKCTVSSSELRWHILSPRHWHRLLRVP